MPYPALEKSASSSFREVKHVATPLQLYANSINASEGQFEGYASLFNMADLGKDMVMRGAFQDSLRRRGARGIRMLWQHDPGMVLGRWLSITEDEKGLAVRGLLNLGVEKAREALALLREGSLDGLSIGFRTEKAFVEPRSGLRRLQKLDLWEISLVTFPMLPGARVSSIKTAYARDLQNDLRHAAYRLFQ
jgi:HK97 family phage prohead protease